MVEVQEKEKNDPAEVDIDSLYDLSTRRRFKQQKTRRALEKTVGDPADLVPFAWRNPIRLTGQKKISKTLHKITAAEDARRELVPAQKVKDE